MECPGCGIDKDVNAFNKKSNSARGVQSRCKSCQALERRAYYIKNKESICEKRRSAYRADPSRDRRNFSVYYKNNREYMLERAKRYYEENKDRVLPGRRLARRAWGVLNSDKIRVSNKLHQQRKRAAGHLSIKEWAGVLQKYGHKCLKCGHAENITIDHIVPISKGGTNAVTNLQPLCGKCNSSKGAKEMDYRMET